MLPSSGTRSTRTRLTSTSTGWETRRPRRITPPSRMTISRPTSTLPIRPFATCVWDSRRGYLHADTGRGHDDFPPIDEVFTPDEIPGFEQDTKFTRIGAFIDVDFRDSRTGPRSGGVYGMRYREYWDIDQKAFAFRQTEFEFQQYIPYFNKGRVIAVRSAVVLSFPKEDNQLPVYFQPVLGGNDDLRGFGGYRFRDNHSVYLGVEHRWHAFSNLEMAAFVDAGKVVPLKREVDATRLNYSGGIGFRVRVRSAVVSRTDFAVSREGFRIDLDLQRHLQEPVVSR